MNKQRPLNQRIAVLDIHSPLYLRTQKNRKYAGCIADIYEIVDRAAEAGFAAIQMLPVQDTGYLPSPYMGRSLFSYNPAHFSGAKEQDEDRDSIDYRSVYRRRLEVLKLVAGKSQIDLSSFSRHEIAYAMFTHFYEVYKCRWTKWPKTIRDGRVYEILLKYPQLTEPVERILAGQKVLSDEWDSLVKYSRGKKIEFIMDKPIYPLHNSAEVWANQELFYLNDDGTIKYASGCNNPRDPFGPQYWGHAVYRFKDKPDEVVDYFIAQIGYLSKICKYIRLDHTLALIWKYYLVDPETKQGTHVRALKYKLFDRLISAFPELYFIAEDLGYINHKLVDRPLENLGIPGMRCLQWHKIPKYAKVAGYPELCLAMASNHDLESLPKWWSTLRKDRKEIYTRQMPEELGSSSADQLLKLINLIFTSKAQIASLTLRDILQDGRRYNHPGSRRSGDWCLRMRADIEELSIDAIGDVIRESGRSSYFR